MAMTTSLLAPRHNLRLLFQLLLPSYYILLAASALGVLASPAVAAGSGPVPRPPAACTTTLTSLVYGFRGTWAPEVAKTVYTTTELAYSTVSCGGCALEVETALADGFGGVGPVERVTATITATTPFRSTLAVCSLDRQPGPSSLTPSSPAPGLQGGAAPDDGPASCTYTTSISPASTVHASGAGGDDDETLTVYTASATTTSHVDCAGCNRIAVSTSPLPSSLSSSKSNSTSSPSSNSTSPLPPAAHYNATITAETAAHVTEYVCIKTPSVVASSPSPASSSAAAAAAAVVAPDKTAGSPSPSSALQPRSEATLVTTLSKTVFAATTTLVRSASCGPVCAAGAPGVIPKRYNDDEDDESSDAAAPNSITSSPVQAQEEYEAERKREEYEEPRSVLTRTVYSTVTILDPNTRTHTSFHCLPSSAAAPSTTDPDIRCHGRTSFSITHPEPTRRND